jgi:hypothetical protein
MSVNTGVSSPTVNTSGRPTKCNDDRTAEIARLVTEGNYLSTACELNGIDRSTAEDWIHRGEREEAEGLPDTESVFIRFTHAIKRANAQAEADAVALARSKNVSDRTGISVYTFLDRRFRDHWGQRQQIDVNETKSVTITHVEVCLPPGTRQPSIDTTVTELPMIGPANDSNAKFTSESGDED